MKFLLFFASLLALAAHAGNSNVITSTITVSCTGTSAQVLAQADYRRYLLIQNNGATTVYIKPSSAHTGTEGIQLIAGGNWEPVWVPANSFFCKSASGTDSLTIFEGK